MISCILDKFKKTESKIYQSFEEAANKSPTSGYSDNELISCIIKKNIIFKHSIKNAAHLQFDFSSLRTLFAVALHSQSREISVLDFGGGGGNHYTIARAFLAPNVRLRWAVVETETMACAAQQLLSNNELNFFSDINAAQDHLESIDLAFTSGALQYCPYPLSYLRQIIEANAKNIFITRTALTSGEKSLAILQKSTFAENGPGPLPPGVKDQAAYYPIVFAPKEQFEHALSERYDINLTFIEDRNAYTLGDMRFHMYGYFCTRKIF